MPSYSSNMEIVRSVQLQLRKGIFNGRGHYVSVNFYLTDDHVKLWQ